MCSEYVEDSILLAEAVLVAFLTTEVPIFNHSVWLFISEKADEVLPELSLDSF